MQRLGCSKAVVLKLKDASESPGGLVNTQLGPTPGVAASVGVGRSLIIGFLTSSQELLMLMAWDHTVKTAAPGSCGFYGVGIGQCFAIHSSASVLAEAIFWHMDWFCLPLFFPQLGPLDQ